MKINERKDRDARGSRDIGLMTGGLKIDIRKLAGKCCDTERKVWDAYINREYSTTACCPKCGRYLRVAEGQIDEEELEGILEASE